MTVKQVKNKIEELADKIDSTFFKKNDPRRYNLVDCEGIYTTISKEQFELLKELGVKEYKYE